MPARGRLLTRSPLAPLASRSPFHALRVRSVVMAGHEAALEGGRRRRGRGLRGVGAGGRDKAFWKALFNTDLGNVVREGVRVRHREVKLTGFLDGGRGGKQGGLKLQMRLRAPPAPSLLPPSFPPLPSPSLPRPIRTSLPTWSAPRRGSVPHAFGLGRPSRRWPGPRSLPLPSPGRSSFAVYVLLRRLTQVRRVFFPAKTRDGRNKKRKKKKKKRERRPFLLRGCYVDGCRLSVSSRFL